MKKLLHIIDSIDLYIVYCMYIVYFKLLYILNVVPSQRNKL